MQAMGIDMGTTTVSIVLMDGATNRLKGKKTIAHQAFIQGEQSWQKVQDPEILWNVTKQGIRELEDEFGAPDCIGLTGQMHGMLYVDARGEAVSPLYTWQDGSGDAVTEGGISWAQLLKEKTGSAATGYGLVTHACLQKQGRIPASAARMVTISDYIGMKLCQCAEPEPVIARDMAASWGCFDLETGDFFRQELGELGVDLTYLPRIMSRHEMMGKTPEGIPVVVSLGDNQTSVLGSAGDQTDTVVLNIGTGSQISFGTDKYFPCRGAVEIRPYVGDQYLLTGSGLCGGRAYEMLEQFYREIAGGGEKELYAVMERQAREFLNRQGREAAWNIRTTFAGTRNNPGEKGSIRGIGVDNFCPGAMTLGMMLGILDELHEMYTEMCEITGTKAKRLVGSGNGIRKNPLMRRLAEEMFGMRMEISEYEEEAACGAALHGLKICVD